MYMQTRFTEHTKEITTKKKDKEITTKKKDNTSV